MKKLLDWYELVEETDYYDMVCESYINGQIYQAKRQFDALPYENKKAMLRYIETFDRDIYNFFFDQL